MLLLNLVMFSFPKGGEPSPATGQIDQDVIDKLRSMNSHFIENRGQVTDEIRYYSRNNPSVGFRDDGVMFVLTEVGGDRRDEIGWWKEPMRPPNPATEEPFAARSYAYMLHFEGANKVTPVAKDKLSFNSNFFIGNDPDKWRTDVPNHGTVIYENLYDGVDLVYRSQARLKYEFAISPGADPSIIQLSFEGIDYLSLDGNDLVAHTPLGEVRDANPYSYQGDTEVRCFYVLKSPFSYSFQCQGWDTTRPLTIDPLVYSTFLGGGSADHGWSIAVNSAGNAYVTGRAGSADFPIVPGGFDMTNGGTGDAFVTKLSAAGDSLVYSTFLGGSNTDDPSRIVLDTAGNAFVAGLTYSYDFPVTAGAADTALCGISDAFVTKLNPNGNALVYSTFLGGCESDTGFSIAVDIAGDAYVTGVTESADFPLTAGAFDTTLSGAYDVFLTKFDAAGKSLLYSTLIGGSGGEYAPSIAIDTAGNAFLTADTTSRDFPVTNGSFDTTYNGFTTGEEDVWVAKLDVSGGSLIYSTYIGGTETDRSFSISVDTTGNAYVTGQTLSADFPVTSGSFDTIRNGNYDAFVVKLNATGSSLMYSTYLGGEWADSGSDVKLDSAGNAYVVGGTQSTRFPTTAEACDSDLNGGEYDAFVSKLNPNGSGLIYSTFLGGTKEDFGYESAIDFIGNVYLIGATHSADFPVTGGAFDNTLNGSVDAFVTKLDLGTQGNNPPMISSFNALPLPSPESDSILFAVNATDADGDALTYEFDFESDGVFDISGSGNSATHVYGDDFDGTATVRVSDGNLSTEATTAVIVLNVSPTIDGEITATATSDIILRVAGEKWHDVSVYMVNGGNETLMASLVREPGKPQETSFEINIDVTRNNSLRITYTPDDDPINGQPNGATPAWLTLTFDPGPPVEMHHTFNVRHPDTWNWTVCLNSLLAGRSITFTATATDPGSDDLTFTWEWGDGSPSAARTYFNDGAGPDPYPSPGGIFPFTATDSQVHHFSSVGSYDLKLTVRDDDGGASVASILVII